MDSTRPSVVRRFARPLAWCVLVSGLALVGWAVWRHAVAGRDALPPRPLLRGERSLLLVTVDTTRPDRLQPYGAENVETPNLAALAARGVTFDRAYSVAPITLVAHTSIHTGLEPPQHGVRNNGLHYVPDQVETLAERLAAEGWETAAFVSAAVLDRRYNLDQGFEVYDDDLSAGRERHPRMVADRPAEATVAAAGVWLDALPQGRPFFLWVHLYDPHAAYSPPPPWRDRYADRLYDGEIAYMDHCLGDLLAHPRVSPADGDPASAPVVTVLGDHGESLGEHGEQTHALLAYDSTLHVPWILSIPGGPRGVHLRDTVGQVDFVPTVLDLMGLDPPQDGAGSSLLPLLEGAGPLAPRSLYGETLLPFYTYGWSELHVLRRDRFKWIDAPTPELYDTVRDPRELSNLAAEEPGLAHDLAREMAARGDVGDETANELTLDSEARERLRSLGYLAVGSGSAGDGDEERPDPKSMIDLHTSLERARFLAQDRFFAAAESELRKVLRRDPGNLAALVDLADAVAEQGRLDEAVGVVQRALTLDPGYVRLQLQLADLEARQGNVEHALELTDLALDADPRYLEARMRRAALLQRLGRRDEAEAELTAVLADEPDSAPAAVLFARLVDLPRDPGAAEARVRDALERDPFLTSGWTLLGEILDATGRPEEAAEAWRTGLRRRPDDPTLHAQLGLALARRHAGPEAEVHLREALRLASEARPDLHVALGAFLAEAGRLEEAMAEYSRALEERPNDPGARNNRAIALYRSGRLDEAVAELEDLVRLHPRHADAHNNLAAIALEQGRPEDAEREARRALRLSPRMAEGWNNLGLARAALGDAAAARDAYRRAVEISPDYWQAQLNLGLCLADAGEARPAADLLEPLAVRLPRLADAHLALGRLYAGPLHDPGRARDHLNAFLRQAPRHPEAAEVRRQLATLPAGR